MKPSVGWLLFAALLLALGGAAFVFHQRDQASQALIVAVNAHDAPSVETLLRQGADPNVRDWKTYYPGGGVPFRPPWYEKYLAKLMRRKPRPADPYVGPTVLMISAHYGDTAIIVKLLNHGADIAKLGTGLKNDYGSMIDPVPVSPLWLAITNSKVAAALLLIQSGAPVNGHFSNGATPLLATTQPEIIEALVGNGADVNAATDYFGETALADAVRCSDCRITRLLLKKGAQIEAQCRYGGTPLMLACALLPRFNPTFYVLLENGADVNARERHGMTALIQAAQWKNYTAMKLLLSHGADVNVQDSAGRTAFMVVSYNYSWEGGTQWKADRQALRQMLRSYGANPNLKDKRGKTAADYEYEEAEGRPAS